MGNDKNKTVVSAYAVHVFVRSPNGRGIPGAKVKFSTKGNPYDGFETTGPNGVAELPLLESDFGDGVSSSGTAEVAIEAGMRHHGPMVAAGETFKNGPVKATVLYTPLGDPPLERRSLARRWSGWRKFLWWMRRANRRLMRN